jgi:aldehyde dehydrogenase (NAD+)
MSKFFEEGQTQNIPYRQNQIRSLVEAIKKRESDCLAALKLDLNRPEFEAWVGEIQPILRDAELILKKLPQWASRQRLPTPWWRVGHFLSRAEIQREAYGLSLIISPWNYPLQLALMPLMGSMAGGNVSILKPSEFSPASSLLLKDLIERSVDPHFVRVVEGDSEIAKKLLELPFQKLFFTGSTSLGKEVYQKAAKNLASVSLELGGKCPAILRSSTHLARAAERVLWGKCFNAGQTCVSPDYVVLPSKQLKDFLKAAETYQKRLKSDFSHIINHRHFDRLTRLVEGEEIIRWEEPKRESKRFPLTLVVNPSADSLLRSEEIFGPILPIFTYEEDSEVYSLLGRTHPPLSIYFFSEEKEDIESFRKKTRSGAFVVNDLMVHLTHPNLPFGGIEGSGLGSYHGHASFKAFTWPRSFEHRPLWDRWSLRFPPYSRTWGRFLRDFI